MLDRLQPGLPCGLERRPTHVARACWPRARPLMPASSVAQHFRRIAVSRADLLQQLLDRIDAHPESAQSLRRVATMLERTAGAHGFQSISAAAGQLRRADAAEVGNAGRRLLELLLDVQRTVEADPRAILVVESHPFRAEAIRDAAAATGRIVECCSTWAEAASIASDRRPAAMVIGLMLADGDGRTALLELREHSATARIPVLITSPVTVHPLTITECQALGATRVLEGAIDPSALHRLLEDVLASTLSPAQNARVDHRSGLLTRAGFRDVVGESRPASTQHLAVAQPADGAPFDPLLLSVLRDALPSATATEWDADTVVILMTEDAQTNQVAMANVVDAAAPGRRIVIGVGPVIGEELGESIDAVLDRLMRFRDGGGRGLMPDGFTVRPAPVLVADPDDIAASLLTDRLTRANLPVVRCPDGVDVIALAERDRFSCFILAMKLPGLDGFAVLEKLRASERHRQAAVVMLTTLGHEDDVARAFQLGADDYIVKPFSPREVTARVRRLVHRAAR